MSSQTNPYYLWSKSSIQSIKIKRYWTISPLDERERISRFDRRLIFAILHAARQSTESFNRGRSDEIFASWLHR